MAATLRKRQRGMTLISWLLVLGLAGFFATIGFTLLPIYIEHYSVKHVLAQFEFERDLDKKTPGQIRELMQRRLKVNGVYGFDVKNNVKVERGKSGLTVRVKYDVRRPVIGNVDLVVSFDDAVGG